MQSSFIFLLLQLWMSGTVSSSQNGCSGIPHVPNAQVSETPPKAEYQKGDVLRFTCDTGYISGPTITYMCSPQSGGWTVVRRGSCYLKPCELPEDAENGYYQIIDGEEFVFGTKIKYFCNEGYQMVSREDTRTCLLDGWTNHLPICERVSCVPPTSGGGVRVHFLPENEGPIFPGRFLTFSCDDPEQNLNGSSLLVCGEDGQWNKPLPSCKGISRILVAPRGCGSPPFLSNGQTTDTTLDHYEQNARVQYICQHYHTMEGDPLKTCIDGQWIGEMKCLRPCTTDEEAMRSHNIEFRYRRDNKLYSHHLEWIEFACTDWRKKRVGTVGMRQQCVDGEMQLPTCQ